LGVPCYCELQLIQLFYSVRRISCFSTFFFGIEIVCNELIGLLNYQLGLNVCMRGMRQGKIQQVSW
jgi:hypothetical protein